LRAGALKPRFTEEETTAKSYMDKGLFIAEGFSAPTELRADSGVFCRMVASAILSHGPRDGCTLSYSPLAPVPLKNGIEPTVGAIVRMD
jgi:hypothetical protein